MRAKGLSFVVSATLLLGLCGAGPPPEGVETRFAAGSGSFEYTSGGCGGPSYINRAVEGSVFASASLRSKIGVTGAVDLSGAVARTTDSRLTDPADEENPPRVDEDELGRTRGVFSVSPRIGYHHDYFGVEAGPWVLLGDNEPIVAPAGTIWVGVPRYVYLWGSFLEGPTSVGHLPIEAGLGHSSEAFRAALGLGYEPSVLAEAALRVKSDVPLFIGGRLTVLLPEDQTGYLGAVTAAYTW